MAKTVKLTRWRGKEFLKMTEAEQRRRMETATRFVANETKKEISTKGVKCGTEDGQRSGPGKPPHIECGQLRNSITTEVKKKRGQIIGRVGTNIKYAKFLELGTRLMGKRPFLRPTLQKVQKRVGKILGKKLPHA